MKRTFQILGFPLRLAMGLFGAVIVALALMISPDSESWYEMAESLYNFVMGR